MCMLSIEVRLLGQPCLYTASLVSHEESNILYEVHLELCDCTPVQCYMCKNISLQGLYYTIGHMTWATVYEVHVNVHVVISKKKTTCTYTCMCMDHQCLTVH